MNVNQDFSDNPFFRGNYAPVLSELDLEAVPVSGDLPGDLRGSLYRNGPNPQFPPRDRYHWFSGDGMVHAFHLDGAKVAYRNRWVRTPKWQMENAAGHALFGSFGNPMTTEPDYVGQDSGLANTNIVWHGGRLLALEEAHAPTQMDPISLETLGYYDFGGQPVQRVTAHPKFDPETGEMVFFAYFANGPFSPEIGYYVADRTGQLTRAEMFRAPYAAMIHDYLVTRNYVLFPVLPLTGSGERAMAGAPAFAWEPERGAYLGILRRDRPIEEIVWQEIDPCYVFHPMNAYETADGIVAEVLQYDAAPLFPRPDGSLPDADTSAYLSRWRIEPENPAARVAVERLDNLPGEFPRFDERFAGLPYRIGWYAFNAGTGAGFGFNGLALWQSDAGGETFVLPDGDGMGEPVFVPRDDASAEGDGYVLAPVYRAAEERSDLLIFDAMSIAKGPRATVQLPVRVPFGFHGNWRPD